MSGDGTSAYGEVVAVSLQVTDRARPALTGAVVVLLAAALGGCGGGGSNGVVRPPSTTGASPTASPTPSPTVAPSVHPVATVVPSTGLHDKQVVTVTGSGFSPNLSLTVVQCADKGTATGAGDCNLAGMQSVSSDASGRLTVQLEVLKGPFGTNGVVCSAKQRCLVSVTQASLTPTEEADAAIAFAG